MPEPRAIVFDLDDTLYPLRSFVRSGFAAVADCVSLELGVPAARVLRALCRASRVAKGRELQHVCARLALPTAEAARFVDLIRRHTPRLRLPRETARVLARLRPGWRIGVLTNGLPPVQRRKVEALGLCDRVDAVVFATECGDGTGKPDRAAFQTMLARLGASPERSVFVGDDVEADVFGARRIGMRTIHVVGRGRSLQRATGRGPDVRVDRLSAVPRAAEQLVRGVGDVR
jgi:putative hydrolase of the HAD superfamily